MLGIVPNDPKAPFGRHRNGKPKAPYGWTTRGRPRKTPLPGGGPVGDPEVRARQLAGPTPWIPATLEPLAGFVDRDTIAFDPGTRTVSVSAPGLEPGQFGRLLLAHSGGYWELCFPGSALALDGNTVSLTRPAYPGGAVPSPTSISIDLYRLDEGATPDDMLRFKWHRRRYPLPSFAMQSAFTFL